MQSKKSPNLAATTAARIFVCAMFWLAACNNSDAQSTMDTTAIFPPPYVPQLNLVPPANNAAIPSRISLLPPVGNLQRPSAEIQDSPTATTAEASTPDDSNGGEPDSFEPVTEPDPQADQQTAIADEHRSANEIYTQLSNRIDRLDQIIQREQAEKSEFRAGVLEVISELEEVAVSDRETQFFDQAGFRYLTNDRRYELAIRGQAQVDSRIFEQVNQDPVNNGFYLPRSRVYFAGRVSPAIEYQFSLQRGFNNLNVLNAYARLRFNDTTRLTVGRFKTPYTYDFYTYKNWHLLSPERSLFNVNFALNRMVGAMASGRVLDNRLEYAAGVFNGPRNEFRDTNSDKDVIAFLNFQPWRNSDGRSFNVGGSVAYGRQDNPLRPAALRTSTNASTDGVSADSATNNANVPFLEFNDGVRELGERNLWELHTSLYLGPLTLLAAWDSGYSGYSLPFTSTSVRLPLNGYHVQAGYMLTGEEVSGPGEVRPYRPYDPRNPLQGLGAWQLVARYSELTLGEEVFTAGLADPALWTRRVQMVDVGLNWHANRFVKITFDWEHAMFDTPVAFNETPEFQINSDLFWARLNLIF